MRKSFAACALALAMLLPWASASAWNHKGHMTVALIAYQQLTPQERRRVFRLLSSHPDIGLLNQNARATGTARNADTRMLLLFITAARWPDLIRSDPRFFDETKNETPTKKLRGFPDMMKHRPWHFKDQGFRDGGASVTLPDDGGNNAEAKIHDFGPLIGSPRETAAHRAYYLAWLEHLVGDVHQPLHCTTRVTNTFPAGDHGGNLFPITSFSIPEDLSPTAHHSSVRDLHSFWDDVLGKDTTLAAVRALAAEAEASAPTDSDTDLSEADWIAESFREAKTVAYKPLTDQRATAPVISQDYFTAARALALQRMKLAGHRLAAVIRANLK